MSLTVENLEIPQMLADKAQAGIRGLSDQEEALLVF
jgi:hypothetical protein